MSVHEIEDLIEGSVRVLNAQCPIADRRVRDWFAALYRFHALVGIREVARRTGAVSFDLPHGYRPSAEVYELGSWWAGSD